MSCLDSSDYSVDPLERVYPIKVEISVQNSTLTIYYQTNIPLVGNSQFLVYVNGSIFDRNGVSGKQYKVALKTLVDFKYFAVVVIPPGLSETYDPLCNIEYNMFSIILKDSVLDVDEYVCDALPIYDLNNKPNFVDPSYKQKGITIDRGSKVHRCATATKPAGPSRSVISINDYRYFTNWDIQAYRTGKLRRVPCSPYYKPAYATCSKARTGDGLIPISNLIVEKL